MAVTVLPEPLSPTTATLSPALISKLIPFTASVVAPFELNLIFKFSTLSMLGELFGKHKFVCFAYSFVGEFVHIFFEKVNAEAAYVALLKRGV